MYQVGSKISKSRRAIISRPKTAEYIFQARSALIFMPIKNKKACLFKNQLIKWITITSIIFCFVFAASIATGQQSIFSPEYTVRIYNTKSANVELALSATKKAYDFFLSLGYPEQFFLELVFQKEVIVENGNSDYIRVYGKLGKNNQIYLTNWNEPWLKGQNSYGLKMSKAFYESVIVHEVAHFIAEKIVHRKIENTLSEYIAYVVQFSQMSTHLRQTILSQRPLSAFETEEISIEVMLMNPAVFAVKSYLHFKKNKGQYLKAIVSGTIPESSGFACWHFH